jgi:methionine-rich copper-binding protein CopC
MTINPSADLAAGTIYYVNISAGAVKDAASNNFAGITNATTWRFTTASAADVTLPTATVFLPTNLATGVAVGANLVLGFSENITAGTGTIEIREKATGITFESFVMPSAKVTFSGSSMTINPTNDLGGSKAYYVYIPNGAVKDLAGNNYAGILNELSWSFTTVATVDATPPTLLSFIPANNATNVEVNANMVLVFSEPITKVAAKIVQVYKVNGSVVVGNYTTDSPELTLSGNTLTINPSLNLDAGTLYSVYIVGGAFQDAAGNLFAGLTNSNTWKFTTSTITGLDNETANQNISVMPNPVENMLTIQTEGFISAELYDIAGVKVANGNTTTMNISELPAGVYILNVNSTNGNFKKQIVKK